MVRSADLRARPADVNGDTGTKTRRGRRSPAVLAGLAAAALVAGGVLSAGATGRGAAWAGAARVAGESPVTPMDQSYGASHNSPQLLVDPSEPRFVAMANRLDAPDFGCALQVSGDGGRGWLSADPVPRLPEGADKCYAPEIAFGADGVLYYLFVGLAGDGNLPMGAFLTSTTDRGRTFSRPREVLGPLNFGVRMAFDPTAGDQGRLHLAWLHSSTDPPTGGMGPPPNPVLTAHSDDGGKTFSEPVTVAGAAGERVVAPALLLGAGGRVHLAWFDLGQDARDYQGLEGPVWEGTWSLMMSTVDGGGRFSRPVVVDDGIVAHERVMLVFTMPPPALVASGEHLCAAWTDARDGDADAVLRCSGDAGRTWGALRRLNDDGAGNGRSQYLPRLSASAEGRLDAVFLDRRGDPNNRLVDVYATYSTDGGRSFERNLKLSGEHFPSDIGQQYVGPASQGLFEYGSRLGLVSGPYRALAAWPDTRNSRPNSTSQDLFVAAVELPGREGGAGAAGVAGAGLLGLGAAGLVAAGLARRRSRSGRARPAPAAAEEP